MDLVLMEAARSGNYPSVSNLPGAQNEHYLLESVTAGKNNVLHIAGKSGNKAFVVGLIDSQVNPLSTFHSLLLQPNNKGNTPLHCAANAGNSEIVKLLISKMDDVGIEKKNNHGDNALHLAVNGNSDGHFEVVKMLVERHERLGLETNHSKEFPLYVAAERGSLKALNYLLMFRQFPATGSNGKTALHAAVARSTGEFLKKLLEERPELLLVQEDVDGSTPLHYVASCGDERMTRKLLSHGDELFKSHTPEAAENGTLHSRTHVAHISDNRGMSPIHVASVMGYVQVIEEILKSRSDTCELVDKRGRTFLHLAVKQKRIDVVRFVIDSDDRLRREILNQQDDKGNTPLHLAVKYHHVNIVKLLLKEKEVVAIVRNFDGFTPLDLAATDFKSSKMEHRMFEIIKGLIYSKAEFSARRLDLLENSKSESQKQVEEEEEAARCRAVADNLTIVSVLVATVTFAAAFTLPGGYNSDDGTAILANRASFKTFLITNTVAMVTSMVVTYLLVQTRSQDHDIRLQSINTAKGLMQISIGTMAMAFGTGTYVVISPNSHWLAEVIVAMACVVPLALYTIKTWPSWYRKLKKKFKSFVGKIWKILRESTSSRREAAAVSSPGRSVYRWLPIFEIVSRKITQHEKISRWNPGSMTHFKSPVTSTNTESEFSGELRTYGPPLKLSSRLGRGVSNVNAFRSGPRS